MQSDRLLLGKRRDFVGAWITHDWPANSRQQLRAAPLQLATPLAFLPALRSTGRVSSLALRQTLLIPQAGESRGSEW